MHYYLDYAICALLFMSIITIKFFSSRRFPNLQNRIFGIILWFAIIDLMLDIGSSLTIEHAAVVPVWINYVVTTVFHFLQVAFPAIMAFYVVILRDHSLNDTKTIVLLLIPMTLLTLALLINPFTHMVFSFPIINGSAVYVRGPLFYILHIGAGLYIGVTLWITLRYRDTLQDKQVTSILIFILILVIAVTIQVYQPAYLLSGVAMTAAILIMYFSLQNPDDMLDLISGVFNYIAMMDFLNIRLKETRQLWLVAVDIGGIRRVNSVFGISTGNKLFAEIGKFFNGLQGDIWPFRMISTRFLIIASNNDEYRRIIDEIETRFQSPWQVQNASLPLSVTIRYFSEWDFFKSPEDVVNLIDVAYSDVGIDGWGVKKRISTDLLLQAKRHLLVENAIREALQSGSGFFLHFQPIYDQKQQRFTSVEALLRLESPELGAVTPAEFIPIAEKTGMILPIDELVIKEVCAFYDRNKKTLGNTLSRLNINLSAAEFFKNPSARIHGLVRETRLSPDLICFEVTETATIAHPKILARFMNDMKSRGYHFALDDFGTGYANIAKVAALPFDTVKLDTSLLATDNKKNITLFACMLDMFSKAGIFTVVEGVETPAQARRVRDLCADRVQGYYYARPMPAADLIAFLEKQRAKAPDPASDVLLEI